MADPYSVLFEPVKIGPVTAPNRFYQVPHCTGLGHVRPQAEAAGRAMKAAGGWGVICTQETEIHPTSDIGPAAEHRLWDDRDIPAMRLITDGVHAHGALAGIELAHNGFHAPNLGTRAPIFAPSDMVIDAVLPKQARAMDKADIKAFRQWHKDAAKRSKAAGFDIVYVYAGHRMTLLQHFLLPDCNHRMDEYGGSLENRARLIREVLEDTHDAVGDTAPWRSGSRWMSCAVRTGCRRRRKAARWSRCWLNCRTCGTSTFRTGRTTARPRGSSPRRLPEALYRRSSSRSPPSRWWASGALPRPMRWSSMVKRGMVDLIGAARPSIADPFLPKKIHEGRVDDIRECIGCNVCVSAT